MAINKFYPTPSTTKCYIGDIELDDIFRVDFKRNINHQPIYGYNDQQFGFVAKGKELVSGQIVINFRYPGYLASVLKKMDIHKQINEKSLAVFDKKGVDISKLNKSARRDYILTHLESLPDVLSKTAFAASLTEEVKDSKYRETEITHLKDALKDLYINDIQESQKASMQLNEFSGFNSPLDFDIKNTKFDLIIQYGFHENSNMYKRVFKDCVLVGESSTASAAAGAGNDMSSSAQSILEIYPFFARTIDIE